MKLENPIPPWLRIFAVSTAVLTWLLLLLGGIVHGTGSSLACPDWPTCYGTFFPEMKGGIFFEHSHRVVAATVGLFTIILALAFWRKKIPRLTRLAFFAVSLVILQGVLGGITVIYRLPPAVSTAHLALSMIYFALMVWIAGLTFSTHPKVSISTKLSPFLFVTAAVVYLQIVLGGLIRHLGAGLACYDIPFCHGSLWPPEAGLLLKLHMMHRIFAIIVALVVWGCSWRVIRSGANNRFLKVLCLTASSLIVLQIALGLFSITTALGLVPVTAHLGVGALLWITVVMMNFVKKNPDLQVS